MAGFAVFMTIVSDGFLALVVVGVSSLCLYFYAKRRASSEGRGRRVVTATALAPWIGLVWLVIALLIHVQISNRLAHQDCGLSGDPYVTLPNGYVLGSLNTYDGYFKAPGFETDMPVAGPGYVRSIVDLQLSNGFFIGTQFDFNTSRVRHFVFDTRTREFHVSDADDKASGSSNAQQLDKWAAAETSVHSDADSYWKLYAQYRHHWPNYVLAGLIIAGEGAIAFGVWKLWAV
jgi:hypothetical protein